MKQSKYNIDVKINGEDCIYNSLSKAFILKDAFEFINDDSEVKKTLYENGFIIDNEFDELLHLQYLYQHEFFNKEHLTIIVTPTWSCNLKCPYCVEKNSEYVLQTKNYFSILKEFSQKNFGNYKHIHISLFGGEPLLFSDDLFDYLNYVNTLKSKNTFEYTTSITTNGTLISSEILRELSKHNCKSLQITLDGNKNSHDKYRQFKVDSSGSFDLLIDKIKLCVEDLDDSCNLVVRFNLNNIKSHDLIDTLSLFNENERKRMSLLFRLIYNTKDYKLINDTTFNDLKSFYDLAENLGFNIQNSQHISKQCEAGGDSNMFYILPDLTLWKCLADLSIKEANIGFIDSTGDLHLNLSNLIIWYNASDWTKDTKCNNCNMLPDCLGGCILYKVKNKERQCRDFSMFSLPHLYASQKN